jgi:hypothetical protein
MVPNCDFSGTDQMLGCALECFLLCTGRCVCCAAAAAVGIAG